MSGQIQRILAQLKPETPSHVVALLAVLPMAHRAKFGSRLRPQFHPHAASMGIRRFLATSWSATFLCLPIASSLPVSGKSFVPPSMLHLARLICGKNGGSDQHDFSDTGGATTLLPSDKLFHSPFCSCLPHPIGASYSQSLAALGLHHSLARHASMPWCNMRSGTCVDATKFDAPTSKCHNQACEAGHSC